MNTKAIILGYSLNDFKTPVKQDDLICVDDVFYNIEKIDESLSPEYKYYIKNKINGELMNFAREEFSKANIAYFDYKAYHEFGIKRMIASVPLYTQNSIKDIIYIKAKFANEWEMGRSEFDNIKSADFIGLDFEGKIEKVKTKHYPDSPEIEYDVFKINIPEIA